MAAMQRSTQGIKQTPGKKVSVTTPDTPLPDYEDSPDSNKRSSFKFVKNFQNVITNIRSIEELYSNFPEPDPDYVDDEQEHEEQSSSEFPPPPPPLTADQLSEAVAEAYDLHLQNGTTVTSEGSSAKDPPLIAPKPLHNPCAESKERQALHRELLLNYKIGKDVLQKPELNKVLRDRRETQRKKEWEEQKSSKSRSSLELKLKERATKVEENEQQSMKVIKEEEQAPEFVRMHRKITLKPGGGPVQS